ncbi:hypothetical protein Ahy_A07g034145 [Arachis hypogaea]|uniref:Uncharacterized protein n=1 Tax=Arachis hypogaea TaxID=3818 RepID=A0A445CB28_ARAHY|nr:hypothetical protein Ahy_A07g034145 [Arachis hypogaea]
MHFQIYSLPSFFFNAAFSHSNFSFELTSDHLDFKMRNIMGACLLWSIGHTHEQRQRVKEVKSAIRQSRRSMPINGYEARVVMALLQCVETLQGDLKVAIKEDKDWYSRFMPLTEVIMKFVVNRSLVKMIEQIEEEQYNGIDVYSLFSDMLKVKEERRSIGMVITPVLQKLFGQAETQREQHCWYSPDLSLVATTSSSKLGRESFIDLNLPALAEEDDASQFEDSAVSDAEFVNPVKVFSR